MISPFALPGLIVWSLDYFGRFRGEVLFLAIRTLDLYGAINVKFTHITVLYIVQELLFFSAFLPLSYCFSIAFRLAATLGLARNFDTSF